MKKLLLHKLLLLMSFLPVQLFAQDITGLWKGEIYVDSTKKYLPYEISISEVKGKLSGYSIITFEENGKQETGLRDITIEKKEDGITIVDVSLLENSFSIVPPKEIKKTMVVNLIIEDTIMTLTGYWSTNRTRHYLAATGSVELHRKNDYKATALYKKLASLKLTNNIVFNEPEKTPEPTVVQASLPKLVNNPVPEVLTNPDIAKKEAPVIVKEKIPTPPVTTSIAKVAVPVEIKKAEPPKPVPTPTVAKVTAPVVVKPAPSKPPPAVAVATKPAPPVTKQVPPPVAAPVIVVKSDIVEKKPDPVIHPNASTGAADVSKRVIASTQSVFYQSDSLVLTLYDNGYVDGDTVSVVMNGDIIFSKQGLSTKAVNKTIYITKETPDSIKLVMYAENLGSIPPNTGLLVVHDGESVYEVRFSADLKSNAAIILTRKKKE